MREAQIELSSITISFFVHATEDIERILLDLSNTFGLKETDIACESVEGHFGNLITLIKVHVIGERSMLVARCLTSHLSKCAKSNIMSELRISMDQHDSLYLRFDRQTLHRQLELDDDEPIRIKLKPKFRLADRSTIMKAYTELLK